MQLLYVFHRSSYIAIIPTHVVKINLLILSDNSLQTSNRILLFNYSAIIRTQCDAYPGSTDINVGSRSRCETAGDAISEACAQSLVVNDSTACTGTCGVSLATAAAACITNVS